MQPAEDLCNGSDNHQRSELERGRVSAAYISEAPTPVPSPRERLTAPCRRSGEASPVYAYRGTPMLRMSLYRRQFLLHPLRHEGFY